MTTLRSFAFGALVAAGILALCGVSWFLGRSAGRKQANLPVNVRVDTLTVRDTIREKYPVYVDRWKTRTELVQVRDTVRRTDTLYMALDIERRTYEGDEYRAVVSGWRPQLEEIAVFPKTVYLQTEVTQAVPDPRRRTRVGFGITAGPAVIWTPEGVKGGAGVAAGLTVTF